MRLWPTRKHIYLHDVALLKAHRPGDESSPGSFAADCRSVELKAAQGAEILQLHQTLGHRMTQQRLNQRFRNGLRFLAFHQGDTLLGSSWVAIGGARYVDELNWYLPILPTEFWVRDVFIMPSQRGRGLFGGLVKLIAQRHVPGCTAAWSDVDWINGTSMRAHAHAGFEVYARLRALDFDGRLRLRGPAPSWHEPVLEIDPGKRLLLMQGVRLQRHQALMA